MKNKKYFIGGIVTGLVFCAAIVWGSFIAPNILASAPEKGEVDTYAAPNVEATLLDSRVTATPVPTDGFDEITVANPLTGPGEPDKLTVRIRNFEDREQPDINAISREQAIEAAIVSLAQDGYDIKYCTEQPVTASYTVGSDPANGPWWNVHFIRPFAGTVLTYYDAAYEDKYPDDAVIDKTAGTVTWYGEYNVDNTRVAVNALTGEVPYASVDTDNHNWVVQLDLENIGQTVTPTPAPGEEHAAVTATPTPSEGSPVSRPAMPTVAPTPSTTRPAMPTVAPTPTGGDSDNGETPDYKPADNAISKEQAIEAAYQELAQHGGYAGKLELLKSYPVTAYYAYSTARIASPVWVVTIDAEDTEVDYNGTINHNDNVMTITMDAFTGLVAEMSSGTATINTTIN
jgi:hypothetical protein